MAYHFSANQFEKAYSAKRLSNWELPRVYPTRPRHIKCCAKAIANNDGHLLPGLKRDKNPWGNFRTTYMLPERLTRRFADEYHECLVNKHRWRHFPQTSQTKVCNTDGTITDKPTKSAPPSCPTKCETAKYVLSFDKDTNRLLKCKKPKKSLDLEYIPGDLTHYQRQHPSRQLLLEQKYQRDNNIEADLPLDKLDLNSHECKLNAPSLVKNPNITFTPTIPHSPTISPPHYLHPKAICTPLPLTEGLTPPITPPLPTKVKDSDKNTRMQFTSYGSISRKPNERCPSPIVPVCANFELAKRMHHENLDHQPLPDCIDDLAYRKLQLTGESSEQVLDLDPIATGMGVRTHNVGPTHCTKLKVYRPKTAAVVPKVHSDRNNNVFRPFSSRLPTRKVGAMDLAICWDYEPPNPADEPQPTRHIDGSNGSASPAVFNFVKTPRDEPTNVEAGHSAGFFDNTLAEPSFFDKDTLSRKTDFTGRPIDRNSLDFDCGLDAYGSHLPAQRALSASRAYSAGDLLDKHSQLYQSSPNLVKQQEIKSLREKYLGGENADTAGRRANSDFLRRTRSRLCHKIAPEPACCSRPEFKTLQCKAAFRAGLPKYNARGDFFNSDSGCMAGCNANRVLVVPRPRNPYMKKNYDIDTLVPPFRSHAGGAAQGGYPEHWRLSSVYQHAFKPLEQRKRPMMQTVYK